MGDLYAAQTVSVGFLSTPGDGAASIAWAGLDNSSREASTID
jgi:hypothetical protein